MKGVGGGARAVDGLHHAYALLGLCARAACIEDKQARVAGGRAAVDHEAVGERIIAAQHGAQQDRACLAGVVADDGQAVARRAAPARQVNQAALVQHRAAQGERVDGRGRIGQRQRGAG